MAEALSLVVGYLIGSIDFAVLAARLKGVDIYAEGSGNPGASNVARVIGRGAGALVLIGDLLKGVVAAGAGELVGGTEASNELRQELRAHVASKLGPIARPRDVFLVPDLPKTRSGKIMRRLLRDIASGQETLQDTSTLEDYSVLAKLREHEE